MAASRFQTVQLQEQTLLTPESRVDRAAGVIYGLKLLGRESKNSHGVKDDRGNLVEGTVYTPEAVQKAAPFYEGLKANANHPPRNEPGKDRSVYDRVGKYFGVEERDGELFGNLRLIPSHPLSSMLMDTAANPNLHDCFACSHNAYGRGEVQGGKFVIVEIPESSIRSVDIVADGGSCHSLFESREMATITMKSLFTKTLKKAPRKVKKRLTRLLEMEDFGAMQMDAPVGVEEPPADLPAEEGWEHHFGQMISAILKDESMTPEEQGKKITAAVKALLHEEKPPAPPLDEDSLDDGDDEEVAALEESLRVERCKNKAFTLLMEARLTVDAVQTESVALLGTEEKMKAWIAAYPKQVSSVGRPTSGERGRVVQTTETRSGEIDLAQLAKTDPAKLLTHLRN